MSKQTTSAKNLPDWEWCGEGACQRCGDYVPQLARCRACGTDWLCDDCTEDHECE
jgi:hypothetical protein